MKISILRIVLTLFFSINIAGCSLFSSSEEQAETATMSESGEVAEGDGDFAGDEFELGDAAGEDFGDGDFDAESMAKGDGDSEAELADLAGSDVEVEDTFGDEYPDDDFGDELGGGEASATTAAAADDFSEDYIDDNSFAADDEFGDDFAAADPVAEEPMTEDALFVDEGGGLPSNTMTDNQEQDLFGQDAMEPVVDTPTFADTSYDSGSIYDGPASGGVSTDYVSVKKIKPAAYKRAGGNVNRLYVVRPGDNMDSIAEKIYGSSMEAEKLYSFNSHHRGRTLDVGDKVYYESPNNPNDPSMVTYFEDNNMSPSYYTSQEGDNIRKVAKKLLGHDRSWMEIYATNANVESKGRLPAGLQIRYWPEGGSAAPILAANEPPAEITFPEEEPAEMIPDSETIAMNDPAEIPEMEEPAMESMDEPAEMANLDEPDALDEAPSMDDPTATPPPAVGQVNNNPPPNQPVAPPPPPPAPKPSNLRKPVPPAKVANNSGADPLAALGNDTTIMGALGGLFILAAIIMLIFIRRSRAKRVNFSQTQV